MADAYIIDAVRTPRGIGKAGKGSLSHFHPGRLLAKVLEQVESRNNLNTEDVDDVVTRLTELPFPPFLEVGMSLDGLRVQRELHASNRSQVYLVEDTESGEQYCMKTPSVNFEDYTRTTQLPLLGI